MNLTLPQVLFSKIFRAVVEFELIDEGDKISVYADLKQGSGGTAKVYVDLLNQEVFEKGYEQFSKNVMTTTMRTSSAMEGTIKVDKAGLFYTSIPYEKGWRAIVDGEDVEITPVGGSLVAFPLSEGEHDIRLVYRPQGFHIGLLFAGICALIFAAAWVLTYAFKKKLIIINS